MEYKSRIELIDEAIKHLEAKSNSITFNKPNSKSNVEELKQYAISVVKRINGRESVISAIEEVSFSPQLKVEYSRFASNYDSAVQRGLKNYTEGVMSIISILRQEKEYYNELIKDEVQQASINEQKKNNKIQIWTLICSIVAALAALAALYPIIESLIKNKFN